MIFNFLAAFGQILIEAKSILAGFHGLNLTEITLSAVSVAGSMLGAISGPQTLITYLAFTAIIIARYFLIVWPIYWLLWKRPARNIKAYRLSKQDPKPAMIKHEITLSTLSAFIYAAPAAIIVEMWKAGGTALYTAIPQDLWGWSWIIISAMIYLFAQDTWFYWTHRIMHHRKIFKWAHAGHHKSVQPTPWASFSFDAIEALSAAWLLPVMALFIPLHMGAALTLLMVMTINAVFNHAGWEVYPQSWVEGWWGRHIITASHHNRHHTQFKGNYGLYFRFWDKIMGTDTGLILRA